jgi:hypothetical protein
VTENLPVVSHENTFVKLPLIPLFKAAVCYFIYTLLIIDYTERALPVNETYKVILELL